MDVEDLFSGGNRADATSPAVDSPLKSLQSDLDFYNDSIKEIALEMMAEGYTAYPVFIAHQHEVQVGEVILDRTELNTNWTINASSFEEFLERGIIDEEKKDSFIQHYKPAKDYMCLFVVVAEGANFVFSPYK